MCLKNHLMLDHCPHNSHCFRTFPDLTRPALSNSTPLGSAMIVGTPEGLNKEGNGSIDNLDPQ